MSYSEYSVAELAVYMRNMLKQSACQVLLVGYDGGSALLNHARPARMLEEIRQGMDPGKSTPVMKLGYYWSRIGNSDLRQQFLEDHTRPTDSDFVDLDAISVIAQLLADDYLSAVVVTDVNQLFYNHLRLTLDQLGVRLSLLDGIRMLPATLGVAPRDHSRKIFVEAGELLLNQCRPGRFDLSEDQMKVNDQALRKFIASFDQVYCWGWHDVNMSLNSIYPPHETKKRIYVLGEYSESTRVEPENGRVLITTNEQTEDATTEIFKCLADVLELGQAPPATSVVPPEQHIAGFPELPDGRRPLLTNETLGRMRSRVAQYPLTFIGIQSERVRECTTLWLLRELASSSSVVYSSGDEVIGLARRLAMDAGAKDRTVIGQLGVFAPASSSYLSSIVHAWQRALESTRSTGTRIALVCPIEVSEWVGKNFDSDEIWTESHYEHEYLAPDPLAEWLMAELLPMNFGVLQGEPLRLADLMLSEAAPRRPARDDALTWWPDTLSLWLQRISGRLPAPEGIPQLDTTADALARESWLCRHWIAVLDEMSRVTTVLAPQFDLMPVLRVAPIAVDDLEFDIRIREQDDPTDDGDGTEERSE